MQHLKISIDVTKIDKTALYEGKHGAKYLSLCVFANRAGEDQYGNTHSVKQDLGKDRRDEQAPFIGRGKPLGGGGQNAHNQAKSNGYQPQPQDDPNDDIPF